MTTPVLPPRLPISPRARATRSRAAWLLGLALCGLLAALAARAVLVRQMRLPRLTLDQGGNVTSVAIAPDGKTAFSGDDPTRDALHLRGNKPADVFVWDTSSGRLVRRLHGFYWRSEGVTASPDGAAVLACGYIRRDSPEFGSPGYMPGNVVAYDWRSGRKIWGTEGYIPLSYSPDSRLVGIGSDIHAGATGALVRETHKRYSDDAQTAFSPDGRFFGFIGAGTLNKKGFTDSDNGDKVYYSTIRLHLLHTEDGTEAYSFPFIRVRAFDISRGNKWLAMTSDAGVTGGEDGSIVRRVDIRTGAAVWTRERRLNGPDNDADSILNSVAISPDEKHVVVQSIDGQIIVLDAQTGHEEFRTLLARSGGGWSYPGGLAFSADGKTLISRFGGKVLVWDASLL